MDRLKVARSLTRIARILMGGSILGPGVPDGTGPYGGTALCPRSQDDDEVILNEAFGDDDLKVVVELEDDGYEVEVYQLDADGQWQVVEEYEYSTYDEAREKFEEIKRQF